MFDPDEGFFVVGFGADFFGSDFATAPRLVDGEFLLELLETLFDVSLGPAGGLMNTFSPNEKKRLERIHSALKDAPKHIREYALSESEKKIQSQIEFMLAADARAMANARAGIAFVAAYIAFLAYASTEALDGALVGCIAAISTCYLGTSLNVWAARPYQEVYDPGSNPQYYFDDAEQKTQEADFFASIAKWNEHYITLNSKRMRTNNSAALAGSILIFLSPLVGLLLWCASRV